MLDFSLLPVLLGLILYFRGKGCARTLAFPIAILANIVRIVSLLLIGNHWGGEVAMTYFHDYSSLVFYLVALLVLALIARLLGCHIPLPRKA
ncbi:MAG: archaeosortase/exosortase family protein [Dehalococcoidia bacterium]|nr:archaeosortase/exosortase family protein [Dehalococcoidia bacterium]